MNPVCDRPECQPPHRSGVIPSGHFTDDDEWESHDFDEINHPSHAEREKMRNDRLAADPEHLHRWGDTLYHGTTEHNATDIAAHGFHLDNTTNGRHSGEGVYLTPNKAEAKTYGTHVVEAKVDMVHLHPDPWNELPADVPTSKAHAVLAGQGYHGHVDPDDGAVVVYNPKHVMPVAVHHPDGSRLSLADHHARTAARRPTPFGQPLHPFVAHPDDPTQCVECNLPKDNRHHVADEDFQPRLPRPLARVRTAPGPNGEKPDGIMIAIVPPQRVIKNLPIPEGGEDPDNIHITVAYLGKTSEHTKAQMRDLPELIEAWAETQPKLDARVQGVGTFVNEGSHVLWAAVDMPGVNQMHVSLVDYLTRHGFDVKDNHSFTPHLTLSYEKHHVRFLPKIEPTEFRVREIWCCVGGRWESFGLKG